jgi:TonB family protein
MLVVVVVAPIGIAAQSATIIVGTVAAETGLALMGVAVGVSGTQLHATTDERGEFRLLGVPFGPVEVTARRLGFRPETVRLIVPASGSESANFTLSAAAQDLEPVLVRGQRVKYSGRLAGYYERLARGSSGVFITREQIEKEHPRNLSQLLQRVPGVSLQRLGGGAMGIRLRDRTCWPLVWLDNNAQSSGEADLDGIQPNSLEGIELYLGSTTAPPQYTWTRNMSSCGTILLWSRADDARVPRLAVESSAGLDSLVATLAVFTADQVDRKAALDSGAPLAVSYPPSLYASRTRGLVLAEFVVDTEGHVETGTFGVVASTNPLFAEAVRKGVSGARFTPAMRGGKTVRQLVHQPFEFTASN